MCDLPMGSIQTRPQPLLQHFCGPRQWKSDEHICTQIPIPDIIGHLPGLLVPIPSTISNYLTII